MQQPAAASERGPLLVVWDVVVAPKAAFEALNLRPRWLVVYAITCVLGMLGAFVQIPQLEHVAIATLTHQAATDPRLATLSPAQIEQQKSFLITVQHVVWIFYPLIVIVGILFGALVLTIANAIARGSGTFAKYFAATAHLGLISFGLYYLIFGIVVSTHAPDTLNSQADVYRVMPSLAWLLPADASPKLTALLSGFNIASIWSFVLCVFALDAIGKIKGVAAYVISAVVAFGGLLIGVPFAK